MNNKTSSARSDIRPMEFALAVVGGGAGSAALSALQGNPWVSVGFALLVMSVISLLRWQIASEFNDHQSLEAFAEDIYLLGYLLTLASLLGLAPRLLNEDNNLFHLAGVKLVTTIFGLGIMMIFRQTARRWAEKGEGASAEKFIDQEQLFRAAVSRLNQSATELTEKMEEMTTRFDPDLAGPVAEWSNRVANAFSAATRAYETIPASVANGISRFDELNLQLDRLKLSAANLATALTTSVGEAASGLSKELEQAEYSAKSLAVAVTKMQPAADAGSGALEKLGASTLIEIKKFDEMNSTLNQVALQFERLESALKNLSIEQTTDVGAPVNRLVQALDASAKNTTASSGQLESLKGQLDSILTASRELGSRLGTDLGRPLATHGESMVRINEQIGAVAKHLELAVSEMQKTATVNSDRIGFDQKLLSEFGDLRGSLTETTAQLKILIAKIDDRVSLKTTSGTLGNFLGSGDSGSTNT